MVWEALEGLPSAFREIVVLREIDGMSYKEIATIANVPIGTVMSRLARARKRLQRSLAKIAGRRMTNGDLELNGSATRLFRATEPTLNECRC
jgi:RNA polymerase sigma-70 factor (ECF subfamily)